MVATDSTTRLQAARREVEGSRATRRLRRSGRVPGVLYGGGDEPVAFAVDARELRHALAASGAVIEVAIDGTRTSAVVKDVQRHPVRGETLHVDLLRVRLDRPIQATVVLELEGVDDAPGVRAGGVLEQVVRELAVEALPGDVPDRIVFDASGLEAAANVALGDIAPPRGVTLLDDPETVVASVTMPSLEVEADEEIEQETELVSAGGTDEGGGAGGVTADEAAELANEVDTSGE